MIFVREFYALLTLQSYQLLGRYQDARRAVEQLFERAKSTIGNLIEHAKRLILEQKEEQDREKHKRSGSGMGLSR